VAGRASIVGAAATHVGKVREHNEDAHFLDAETGLFIVCDGMGGHAAGEVASALAIRTLRARWSDGTTQRASDTWIACGTAEAKKALLGVVRDGVLAAHDAIIEEAERDEAKKGMGTTVVGGLIVGGELVFAHAGDSRAYIVRDGIAMQLTEDHTLLSRLLAAGIDVDVSGDGARFRSMLTNALGIGQECKVSTFVVPLADGDRFMLCSDGISEYVTEAEVGEVLTKQPSPARAAQKLVDMALDRGGGDNATAVVVRVLEAGETPVSAEQRRRDDLSIGLCGLWGTRISPQQRLRALRIAIPRDYAAEEKLPAHTLGDRVAWIIVEGELVQDGEPVGPGGLLYPQSLIATSQMPGKDGLAVAKTEVRALALRADDFRELCEDDAELGEALLEGLSAVIASQAPARATPNVSRESQIEIAHARTDPSIAITPREPESLEIEEPPAVVAPAVARTPAVLEVAKSPTDPVTVKLGPVPRPAAAAKPVSAPRPIAGTPAVPATPVKSVTPAHGLPTVPALPRGLPSVPRLPPPLRAPSESEVISIRAPSRPPSEPEIRTYFELEADEPRDGTRDSGPDHAAITVTRDDGAGTITETVTETSSQTLTVTVIEPGPVDDEETKIHAISSNDGPSASGTIPERPSSMGVRAKRLSDGWDADD
jgi:serine/threonine protein phosphatase PrpC